jgi:DNA-binding PadR family transcriptional regulator
MILYNYNILWIGYAVMTNAELVVLSLIAEQPRHGYEIEIVIEDRGMREWTEVGFSSIYYILKKLEKAGLITGHMELADGKGPARKVYRLTPQGHEAWRKSTIEALIIDHRGAQLPAPVQGGACGSTGACARTLDLSAEPPSLPRRCLV